MFSALKKFFTKMRTTPPGRPPNSTSGADAALELSQTVLTILNDMSGVFVNAPYVGMVAGVIQQFITIRNVSSCSLTYLLAGVYHQYFSGNQSERGTLSSDHR
jgi:hypothetical protein